MHLPASSPDLANLTSVYEIDGHKFEVASLGFAEAIADSHAHHRRPRCMCTDRGVDMYVARLAGAIDGFLVKRMPNTGSHHAPGCPSYEPPAECSGLGQVLGSAITEDPTTGVTTLKLDFAMSKIAGRSTIPTAIGNADSVLGDGTRLSLRALLHYLWDQADLTRWQPGFAGKRNWSIVRKHLLLAAENKFTCGNSLRSRLYVPEVFSVDQRDGINARRTAQWSKANGVPGKPQQLMLLIAEVKEIVRARYGFKAVMKHVPNQAFALDEQLYRRLGRTFESELATWGAADDIHMIMIATFGVAAVGIPTITELSLMTTTRQWLPVEDTFDRQLIDRLVFESRSFVKGLRYNLPRLNPIAPVTLTDTGLQARTLLVVPSSVSADQASQILSKIESRGDRVDWLWSPSSEAMPPLPERASALATQQKPSSRQIG